MHVTIDETDAGQKNEYELNVDLKDLPADVDDMSRGDYGKLIALEKAVAGMKESEAASDSDRDFVSDSEGIGRWGKSEKEKQLWRLVRYILIGRNNEKAYCKQIFAGTFLVVLVFCAFYWY